jgi:DNA-binding transcriptional LysR family regulator
MSFSKAAEELGYSQSTVTMQIKQLESELEVELFDRIGKRIVLTEDGRKLLPYANEIITAADNARAILKDSLTPCGELRIGILESVCISFLPKVLNQYHQDYPQVSIIIKIGTLPELYQLLNNNQVDLIWIFDQKTDNTEWIKVLEEEIELVIIASRNHSILHKPELKLSDILDENFILTEKDCSYRRALEEIAIHKGKKLKLFLEIANTEIIKQFVAANLGISLLPKFTVEKESVVFPCGEENHPADSFKLIDSLLDNKNLMILPIKDLSLKMYHQVFYHKNKWLTPAVKEFIHGLKTIKCDYI